MSHLQGRYDELHDRILDTNTALYGEEGSRYHPRPLYWENTRDFQNEHENTAVSKNSERQYKPTALKRSFLITLLLSLLIILAFLIYAVVSLPVVFKSRDTSKRVEARGLCQSSDLIHLADSRIYVYNIEHTVHKKEITTHESVLPISSALLCHSSSGSRDIGSKVITAVSRLFPMPFPSNYGRIGTKTVTETLTYLTTRVTATKSSYTKTETKFGEIRSKTNSDQPLSFTGQIEMETQMVTMVITRSVFVGTSNLADPTTTAIGYPTPPPVRTAVYIIDGGHYFIGAFLPTLISSMLAVAVAILDINAKSFQPWHALTHEQGASGYDSLCLETSGWRSLAMGLRSLASGQTVIFLTSLLSLRSAVLIPVSANAITLDLRGDGCEAGASSASNCAYFLSISPIWSRVSIGILVIMSLATIFLVTVVGRWRLGVYTNPRSMCTLASLAVNANVRHMILDAATGVDMKQAKRRLKHQEFKLDHFRSDKGGLEYEIVALDHSNGKGLPSNYERAIYAKAPPKDKRPLWGKHNSPFFMLGIIGRLSLLFMLSGTLILVLYYAQTGGDTTFERFIDSDSFGVRILFSSLGVMINLFWSSFFSAVAIMTSYQSLAERPREADQSILLAPPTNAFSGLWYTIRTRRGFLGTVSLASIFSQSLSIFLSGVPFRVTQTFFVFQLSAWGAVGIMSFMVLITLSSFFARWPDMPVNPSTIAGAMYYICDTSVIDKFEGVSTLYRKERNRMVIDMNLLYEFGETPNNSGGSKVGLYVSNRTANKG